MPLRESASGQLLPVLEWLDGEPDADPVADLATLRMHLGVLSAPVSTPGRVCAEQLAARAFDLCDRFNARLLHAALPLPAELSVAVVELGAAMLDLAAYFRRVRASRGELLVLARRPDATAAVLRGLRLVDQAFLISAMGGIGAPIGLWWQACELVVADGVPEGEHGRRPEGAGDVTLRFKRLAALSALQPESLTPRELAWAHDYLEAEAASANLSWHAVQPLASAFWIDPSADTAPVALVRASPTVSRRLLYFSAHGVSRRAAIHAEWVKTRVAEAEAGGEHRGSGLLEPDAAGLPVGLTPIETLSLLERMRDRWSSPPSRTQPRRAQQYSVQACAGLRAIWTVSRGGGDAPSIAEWTVYNESSGGYAVLAVGGAADGLCAGMPLALRREHGQPWSICLVRWIRSEGPEHIELGLQLISKSCAPVTVGFHGGGMRLTTPALILPPAAALRRNQAILAPAGTYTSRGFSLVQEGERVYVAQGRVVSLDLQTASVELFQYEIDPYPE